MILQAGLFALGAAFWTFLEYALHRGLGHKQHLKNLFTVEHLLHHKEVNYFAAPYKKAIAAIVVIGVITLLLGAFIGWTNGFAFSLGLAIMYLVYEFTHSRLHTHAPKSDYAMNLRKHHFYHHFNDPDMNHGVTTHFWDKVFGTYVKVDGIIPVPKRSKLHWLTDEKGELRAEYSGTYKLV
jgi:4-hydroxysphinganine ceramide fatty acyl 2-hydroxylase